MSFQNHKYAQFLKQLMRHSCRFKTLQFQSFKTIRFWRFKTFKNSAKKTPSKGKNKISLLSYHLFCRFENAKKCSKKTIKQIFVPYIPNERKKTTNNFFFQLCEASLRIVIISWLNIAELGVMTMVKRGGIKTAKFLVLKT